jgi:acetyl esterase/lipase
VIAFWRRHEPCCTVDGMRVLALLALAVLVPVTAAHAAERGSLLSSERIAHLSATRTADALRSAGLPAPRAARGVGAYRLRYTTVDAGGAPTTASTLLVMPHGSSALPTVVYAHGTLARRTDAPSQGLDSLASAAALLYGAAGYATVAPDYLGLGAGPGPQAYLHTRTEASASIDAVRAARRFAHLDDQLFVTGFSQGGHAAMAIGQALARGEAPELRLGALAPVSGVLDLRGAELPAIVDGRLDGRISAYNISALLVSWQPLYGLGEVFAPAYAERAGELFDGRHGDAEILAAMPSDLSALVTPAFLARMRAPDGAFLRALQENDAVCAWRPRVPVRLFAARGDRAVAIANTRHCAQALGERDVVDLGALDHFPSMFAATPRVLAWFDHLSRSSGREHPKR